MSRKNFVNTLRLGTACIAAMLALPDSAWSAVNKCTGADGKVIYTEQPCPQNQSSTTMKTTEPPPRESQQSGKRRSPGQEAMCERARRSLASLKVEMAQERNKDKTELLATARQEGASLEKLIHEQCD